MPLTTTNIPCGGNVIGVGFPMKDGDKTIAVHVTHEALQDIASPPPGEGEYVARCESLRGLFEQLATDKYDAGQVEQNGTTVIIKSADVRPYRAE